MDNSKQQHPFPVPPQSLSFSNITKLLYMLAYKPTPIPVAQNVAKISDSHISR